MFAWQKCFAALPSWMNCFAALPSWMNCFAALPSWMNWSALQHFLHEWIEVLCSTSFMNELLCSNPWIKTMNLLLQQFPDMKKYRFCFASGPSWMNLVPSVLSWKNCFAAADLENIAVRVSTKIIHCIFYSSTLVKDLLYNMKLRKLKGKIQTTTFPWTNNHLPWIGLMCQMALLAKYVQHLQSADISR